MSGTNHIRQVVRRGPNIKSATLWLLSENLLRDYTGNRLTMNKIDVFLVNSTITDNHQTLGSGTADANGNAEYVFNINARQEIFKTTLACTAIVYIFGTICSAPIECSARRIL